ncbi:MAG: 50S ribosomal protein L23 [Cytophagales bacterium]|nr:MAG: 50S ribosomal protein L23 [Cytophagales bacterium]
MDILIKPLVTEKVNATTEKGIYSFIVDKSANKVEIKKAIEKTYSVNVESVNTLITSSKSKSKFTKKGFTQGKSKQIKKAFIKVAKGEVIDFYSGI